MYSCHRWWIFAEVCYMASTAHTVTYIQHMKHMCRRTMGPTMLSLCLMVAAMLQAPTVWSKIIEKGDRSRQILITDDTPVTIHQERFLTNGKNKARLIQGLTGHSELAGIPVKHVVADADTLIVRTAIELSIKSIVIVVGTDIDLLILLIQLLKQDSRLYLYNQELENVLTKHFSSAAFKSIFQKHVALPACHDRLWHRICLIQTRQE